MSKAKSYDNMLWAQILVSRGYWPDPDNDGNV